jgi:hypothetical protein
MKKLTPLITHLRIGTRPLCRIALRKRRLERAVILFRQLAAPVRHVRIEQRRVDVLRIVAVVDRLGTAHLLQRRERRRAHRPVQARRTDASRQECNATDHPKSTHEFTSKWLLSRVSSVAARYATTFTRH